MWTEQEMQEKMNKIHLGDSLELIKLLPDNCVDLIVTDPPYILDTTPSGKNGILKGSKLEAGGKNSIDFIAKGFDIEEHLREWERISKKLNAFIFCSNKQISSLMKWGEERGYIVNLLIWNKKNVAPLCNNNWMQDIEYIVQIRQNGSTFQGNYKLKRKVSVFPTEISKYGHPTEKPIELIKKYIEIGSKENDIILDPFMGSGTTANACIHLNRQFIGYEIEPKYYTIACERVERAKGNFGLFAGLE